MRAIVLAAGVGHRLAPLTDWRPKCLLPVGGLPWTEIDFVEDLQRAEAETLPQIDRLQEKP